MNNYQRLLASLTLATSFASYAGSCMMFDSFEDTNGESRSCSFGAPKGSTITQSTSALPNNLTTACDKVFTHKILGLHRNRQQLTNAMYVAACTTSSGTKKMFTSLTIKDQNTGNEKGAIIQSIYQNGKMVAMGSPKEFPECSEMHGIATSSDCSVVAALCRRAKTNNTGLTKDLLAEHAKPTWRDWFTQTEGDNEWLYEWSDGNLNNTSSKYIIHKGIGNWEYGRQDLVYSNKEDSYGAYLKTAIGRHDGDTFMVIDRNGSLKINANRGWKHSCGAGHTIFNHATYNPASQRYAGICTTDSGAVDPNKNGDFAGNWVSVERPSKQDGTEKGFFNVLRNKKFNGRTGDDYSGGVSTMLPMQDGGFLGVFIAARGNFTGPIDYKVQGPTNSVGIARFDREGNATKISWVATDNNWFYTSPQIAQIAEGRYLLGYAKTVRLDQKNESGYSDAIRLPSSFHLVEINEEGRLLSQEKTFTEGWGDQDRLVSFSDGSVAWAYIPKPTTDNRAKCEVSSVSLNLYTPAAN